MKCFEMTREIYNNCSGNRMRDVFFTEVSAESVEKAFDNAFKDESADKSASIEREDLPDGAVIFNVEVCGLRERYTFTEV